MAVFGFSTRRVVTGLAGALSMAIGLSSHAAGDYPNRPIKMVIPYTPGGSIDTVGRLVAAQLQRQMGQPIIVENRPGASGMIGSEAVAKAQSDGYTLLFNASSQVYLPLVAKNAPYDAIKDYTAIGQIGHVPLLVVANPNVPANSLRELVQLAKAKPKAYTWATSGLGTTSHLTEEMIRHSFKLEMEIVSYKGAVPQLNDVMGGHVTAAVSPMPGVYPFVKGGRLKVLAVTSSKRIPQLPNVPTVAESGLPGFELLSWYGIWGPANLPADITQRLSREINKAVQDPAVKARFSDMSFEPVQSTPEQFKALINSDLTKVSAIVKAANIQID
ncbi:BUG/TctC family periplasmic protein [Cupriavidus sp. U2]|uniref:Bug family tripartite tricarboxylate transporter substrate binding protein n=1 Tax=Burkholderiaceae TaxID=119060 RepID=UPI000883AC0E|nr:MULTISPECIES: tripartite tricarboxylate transporter substrate binding protein [Burkholderiaceae]KAI3591313.1 BUG/TctC family periplasmic protein [Cupriavidus sp. U2]SDP79748.1 Tripartite-type tricarboxylate transporter, receptor component TctC [Ralstonia sp. 25mfcol4.1]